MTFENLIFEESGAIARITINRPDVLNALNRATLAELSKAFDHVAETKSLSVAILTGAGEKAFIAGADIRELAGLSPLEARKFSRLGQHVCHRISWLGKPVIARGQRIRARRRLRGRARMPHAHRKHEGEARPARGEPRRHPRLGRHAETPAHRRSRPRARDAR